jgi:hypothetical protein
MVANIRCAEIAADQLRAFSNDQVSGTSLAAAEGSVRPEGRGQPCRVQASLWCVYPWKLPVYPWKLPCLLDLQVLKACWHLVYLQAWQRLESEATAPGAAVVRGFSSRLSSLMESCIKGWVQYANMHAALSLCT